MSSISSSKGTFQYNAAGQLHSSCDMPAVRTRDRHEWYCNGRLHRDGQPAVIAFNGANSIQEWYRHGELHHEGGPAHSVELFETVFNNDDDEEDIDIYLGRIDAWYLFGARISKRMHQRLVDLPIRWRHCHAERLFRAESLQQLTLYVIPDLAHLIVDDYLAPLHTRQTLFD